MSDKRKKVALFVGGWSPERQVSLTKGKAVEAALIEAGYDVKVIDVSRNIEDLIAALTPRPDVVFNNLHGKGGEDGVIQGVLEMLKIPYTHSGVMASAIGMDKEASKALAKTHGVCVADGKIVSVAEFLKASPMEPPYVVKPVDQGSSVGVHIVLEGDNFEGFDTKESDSFADRVMVERYIPGRELTVAVLDGKAQTVTEIISATRFFDYEAKYHDTRTRNVMPADIADSVAKQAMQWSETVFKAIGAHGLARCDFRYDESKNELVFLEINTQPGCTPESIGPSQIVYNGTSFSQLCAHLVETACLKDK